MDPVARGGNPLMNARPADAPGDWRKASGRGEGYRGGRYIIYYKLRSRPISSGLAGSNSGSLTFD